MRSKVDQDACGQTRASHCAASFISAWSFGYTRPSFHAPDGPFLFNSCHCPALVRIIGAAQKTHLLVIPDGDLPGCAVKLVSRFPGSWPSVIVLVQEGGEPVVP